MNKQTLRQGLIILAGIAAILAVGAMIIGGQVTWYGVVTVIVALVTAGALISLSSERSNA